MRSDNHARLSADGVIGGLEMQSMRKWLAGVAAVVTLAFSAPASAGGWHWDHDGYDNVVVHHHIYPAPRYVHVYHVHRPAPRYVHVIGYQHVGYAAYRFARPYRYGHAWAAPYYRSYYPVRTVTRRAVRRLK